MRRIAVVVLGMALLSTQASAQQQGEFRAGRWGAEASLGGARAALLRFTSPSAAWVFAFDASYDRVEFESGIPGNPSVSDDNTLIRFDVGRRTYSRPTGAVRPFSTLGLTVGAGTGFTGGAFADFGATHFFTDQVSVGASGGLTVLHQERDSGPAGGDIKQTSVQLSGPRIFVGILF